MQSQKFQEILNSSEDNSFPLSTHIKSLLKHVHKNCAKHKENCNFEKMSILVKSTEFEFLKKDVSPKNQENEAKNYTQIYQKETKNNKVDISKKYLENLENKQAILEIIGKGIGRLESLKINETMLEIAGKETTTETFYFGKILGLEKDYHVIWAKNALKTVFGNCINSIKFYVTVDLKNWIELQKISPKNMRDSRNTKTLFSGKLENQINNFLTEEIYLHCTLVRILYSNFAVPVGFLTQNAELENVIERSVDFKIDAEAFLYISNWVHAFPNIMLLGETYHSYENEPEILEKLEKTDSSKIQLALISEDDRKWGTTLLDSKFAFVGIEETAENKKTRVICLKNNVWPGAINYFAEFFGEFGFFYVGLGVKSNHVQSLISKGVADIMKDVLKGGLKDFKEPNPGEGQEVLETDSEPEGDSADDIS